MPSLYRQCRQIFRFLSAEERRRASLIFLMVLVMAFMDMVGVASIMPFMTVLSNPDIIDTNPYLGTLFALTGLQDVAAFLFFLGVTVFVALIVSIGFKAAVMWVLLRFTQMLHHSLSIKLAEGYLRQPYEFFLNRNSADLGKAVLSEVGQVINDALIPMMYLVVHSAVGLVLVGMLLFVNPAVTLTMSVGLSVSYGVIYVFLRKRLTRLGAERLKANRQRFEALTEVFGGIKEVKVGNLETAFLNRFSKPSRRHAVTQANSQIASQMPRYLLEIMAFGGMLLLILHLMTDARSLQAAMPLISLYAFAAYRLMPALREVFASASKLRFAGPALQLLHDDFIRLAPGVPHRVSDAAIELKEAIRLEDVHYRYPHAQKPALRGLSLVIPARSTVGLIGKSGSGKTTTVDIILGLLRPESGQLRVDDTLIDPGNVHAWRRLVAYVPQHIFLSDDTIEANIAFGVAKPDIDRAAVERAAKIARLHDFVVQQLPEGYLTRVGERGVRLSGGQRQRIGIARALYHRPRVLVMDEATNALDNLTEHEVMEAVYALSGEITIILIAHRLSTVRKCDQILLFEQGQMVQSGSYEEIVTGNSLDLN